MNRRGFFGLLGKLAQVGVAMGIAPELLAPIQQTPIQPKEIYCSLGDPNCKVCQPLYEPNCGVCKSYLLMVHKGPTFALAS